MPPSPAFDRITAKVEGHSFTLSILGQDRLDALLALIDGARESLRLFFYSFASDGTALKVRDRLIAAQKRGVSVSLLVDGFGTPESTADFCAPLVACGGTFLRFTPRLGRSYLLRNHQKIVIADGAHALIGGANIADDYFRPSNVRTGWHDLYLEIRGPIVDKFTRYFDRLHGWMLEDRPRFRQLITLLSRSSGRTGKVRLMLGGPFQRLSPLTRSLKLDCDKAKRVDLVQAYFAPNWGMLRRLARVERRGGDVRLITAAQSDNRTTISAARHCYRRLLRSKIEVYEYLPQKLHMKLDIFDDAVYIGSANFDMRSLFINAEIMVRIEDTNFAQKVRALVEAQLPFCGIVTRESHQQNATWPNRLRWLFSYFLVATVDFTVTRKNLRQLFRPAR